MQKVNAQQLKQIKAALQMHNPNPDFVTYGTAIELLRRFLGNGWTNENVFSMHPQVSKKYREGREFLLTDQQGTEPSFRHQERTTRLAELILRMQDVEGTKTRIARILEGNLEATFAELEMADHLRRSGIDIGFVEEKGEKGSDYDLQLAINNKPFLSAEVKLKQKTTELTSKSLLNSLESARKQLPKNKPGLITVRLPEHWVREERLEAILMGTVSQFFSNTSRIVAIIFRWEEGHELENGYAVLYKFRPFLNQGSEGLTSELSEAIQSLAEGGQPLNRFR